MRLRTSLTLGLLLPMAALGAADLGRVIVRSRAPICLADCDRDPLCREVRSAIRGERPWNAQDHKRASVLPYLPRNEAELRVIERQGYGWNWIDLRQLRATACKPYDPSCTEHGLNSDEDTDYTDTSVGCVDDCLAPSEDVR